MSLLFVSGLPSDVRPREVRNLFAQCNGLVNVDIARMEDGVKARVGFNTNEQANLAMQQWQNYRFDTDCYLKIEIAARNGVNVEPHDLSNAIQATTNQFAHLNTGIDGDAGAGNVASTACGVTRPSASPSQTNAQLIKIASPSLSTKAFAGFAMSSQSSNGSSLGLQGPAMMQQPIIQSGPVGSGTAPHSNTTNAFSTQFGINGQFYGTASSLLANVQPATYSPQYAQQSAPTTVPCTTLFAGNLGSATTERELQKLFEPAPGFRRVRFTRKGTGPPVAFIEFENELCSMNSLRTFQGHVLPTCERGGIRLEYAKTKMGSPALKQSISNPAPVNFFSPKTHNPLYHSLLQRQHLNSQQHYQHITSNYGSDSPHNGYPSHVQSGGIHISHAHIPNSALSNQPYPYQNGVADHSLSQYGRNDFETIPTDLLNEIVDNSSPHYSAYEQAVNGTYGQNRYNQFHPDRIGSPSEIHYANQVHQLMNSSVYPTDAARTQTIDQYGDPVLVDAVTRSN